MQEQAEYARLGRFLDESARFDQEIEQLLKNGWNASTPRHVVTMGFCKAALEHAISQRVLIGSGLHGTALTLIRPHFEATVRAAWVQLSAKDEWLTEFTRPIPPGGLKETCMGPPMPSMLDAIEAHEPEFAIEGRRLHQTVKVMHSFVHGGVHLVAHALRGYPPAKLINVMQNRNLLCLMLCNVIIAASGRQDLVGTVRRLSAVYASAMPPPTATV